MNAIWLPPALPGWFPSERMLSSVLVLVLVGTTALSTGRGEPVQLAASTDAGMASSTDAGPPASGSDAAPLLAQNDPGQADPAEVVAEAPPTATTAPPAAIPTAVPTAPTLNLTPKDAAQVVAAPDEGGLLPKYRILSYYGHPHDENMGILGEYGVNGAEGREELVARLQEQAAEYEAADPSRPVMLALEVIATVAQGEAGADGTYLLSTDTETLDAYADFTEQNGLQLILDVQIGRRGVEGEIEQVMPWLERPNVHLALDPEFAMEEGETPGVHFGQIDGADVTYAQETLAKLVAEKGLPPKILIVHQFLHEMITNKDTISPVPNVQLVIDADGWGDADLKIGTYEALITNEPIQFHGIKLFYRQDKPLMSAKEVLALDPVPDLVIYQ
ncbi:MAG: hypothetical protein M3Q03_04145 [Chloroflexota bacterium]|nr:hypothetical protein [Chloroflexota bacterium]